jgi:hypothetical protein
MFARKPRLAAEAGHREPQLRGVRESESVDPKFSGRPSGRHPGRWKCFTLRLFERDVACDAPVHQMHQRASEQRKVRKEPEQRG